MKKLLLLLSICFIFSTYSRAQVNLWESADLADLTDRSTDHRYSTPAEFGLFKVNIEDLRTAMATTPHENQISSRNSYSQISMPMPDGSFRTFNLVEYEMMEPKLARKYPNLKTYTGVDLEHGSKIHCNLTSNQFFAAIREKGVTYYIDPYSRSGNSYFVVYDIRNDVPTEIGFSCDQHKLENGEIVDVEGPTTHQSLDQELHKRGDAFTLRTYRLAVSATAGFTAFHGGTVVGALDGITTIVNRINSIYEREVAIRLMLIANNDEIIFTTSDDDPFDHIAIGDQAAFLNQNQNTVTNIIGNANYDIGHVLNVKANSPPSGQGIAERGSVCRPNSKARGSSGSVSPAGNAFAVSIISHEMGHQFNANHTMYHCQNVNLPTSVEPGSGSTIMSYAGICSPVANIQNNSDDYFNSNSIQSIIGFSRNGNGNICGEDVDFGNTYPDVILDYPSLTYIPVNTPFKLTAEGADAETPNTLTYCWEQYQNGSRNFEDNPWNIANPVGNEPLFRSRPPISDPTRYFPALPIVVNSSNYLFEQLPDYARDLKFRCTVRDNASENGGAAWDEVNIKVIDNSSAGQFEITNYNVKDTIKSGDYVELTWDVAETDLSPINTHYVNIFLSTDGGTSFPHLLKSHTPNDGSTFVNIPDMTANRFRFMIQAAGNIYYDVTNRSGLLCVDSSKAAIGIVYDDQKFEVCAPDIITLEINTFAIGGYDEAVNFEFNGSLPPGGFATFSDNEVSVGVPTTLTINLENAIQGGDYDISFAASGNGIDTRQRSLELEVTTNNFDNLTLNLPVNGSSGVEFLPTLQWNTAIDANSYNVELSENADFSNIIFSRTNLATNEIALDMTLEAGGVYFWRVMPKNSCDLHDLNRVSSFQVKALSCEEFCSTEPTITLSASGTPTAEMTINTGAAQTVNDLNVTQIVGRHSDMGHLRMTLEGPGGTQVVMMNEGTCGYVNSNINMGFDDDAVGVFPNCINFNDGIRFQPANSLSAMNGLTGSTYKLIVDDVQSGSGGRLDSWCFEICGDADPEKPLLVRADSIEMDILDSRTVSDDKLEVTHSVYTAAELTITIVEAPAYGSLLIEGIPVTAGAQLTMQDVADSKLIYQHEESMEALDQFSFIVTDPGGGFLGTPSIQFYVGISATNETLPMGSELVLFPNPANEALNIRLQSDELILDHIELFTINGQRLSQYSEINSREFSLNLNQYPSGLYLIQAKSGKYMITRKFIKR